VVVTLEQQGTKDLSIRIGALVISANLIFLVVALVFFATVSLRNIKPHVMARPLEVWTTLVIAITMGLVGAWLHGIAASVGSTAGKSSLPTAFSLPLGSLGGFWGVLAGVSVASMAFRKSLLSTCDALIPGMVLGGSIARLADLFTESSRGILVSSLYGASFQPFRPWGLYDILCLLLVYWAIRSRFHRAQEEQVAGQMLVTFLLLYGVLRTGIECVRDTPAICGPLTIGQVMALTQTIFGSLLWFWLHKGKPTRLDSEAKESEMASHG